MIALRTGLGRFLWILIFAFSTEANGRSGGDSARLHRQLLKAFPGLALEASAPQSPFRHVWKLTIRQNLDHNDPGAGTFPQCIYLYHRGYSAPNVLATEGYKLSDRIYEATSILDANQFSVEHRFFGDSRPDSIPWMLLRQPQALEDLRMVQSRLGKIYRKSWTATGASKGGTQAALYSLTYPGAVQATVAYVAPFVLEQEDPRTIAHYKEKVGTPECRQRVFNFQRTLLKQREALKPMLLELSVRDGVDFFLEPDRIIDYAAVEYPFSFWQWGFGCEEIPGDDASAEEVFDHVETVVDFNYYDKPTCSLLMPAYYQFMTEFGYYGFDTTGLSDLLVTGPLTNLEFCPKEADLRYDGTYMREMYQRATRESRNIIYIYGALDTWTACAVDPGPDGNAIKLVRFNGGHRTRIRDFATHDRNRIYKALHKWTRARTHPLPY